MSAFRQCLFRQNSLDQDSPKFFLAKVSSFTVLEYAYIILLEQAYMYDKHSYIIKISIHVLLLD